jgi:hypothetical protein
MFQGIAGDLPSIPCGFSIAHPKHLRLMFYLRSSGSWLFAPFDFFADDAANV